MGKLARVAGSKKKSLGQRKAELAVLLYEAQRTEAWKAWSRSLGTFAKGIGLGGPLFEKLKGAGRVLFQTDKPLYEALVLAVRNGKPRPPLPQVSKLAMLPGLRRRGATLANAPEVVLDPNVRVRDVQHLADGASYGTAGRRGRKTLRQLDAVKDQLRRAEQVLRSVQAGGAGRIPRDILHRRMKELWDGCDAVMQHAMAIDRAL